MSQTIDLIVNGESYELTVQPHRTLLEVLREQLNFMGTKMGCDEGTCGACTVLIDGKPMLACMILALDAQGKEVTTIEGLAVNGMLHPVQEAFVRHGAIQCGFCSPGMILTAKALLDRNPHPTELDIKRAISGNLCRCTGYAQIIAAIKSVADSVAEPA